VEYTPRFDPAKAIEVLVYITARCSDMYNALKVLYFADRAHLSKFGRLICGDSYVAMSHGPVPSGAYDLVKMVRDNWPFAEKTAVTDAISVEGYRITPKRNPDLSRLAQSDIECLDEAIATYGALSFARLKTLSHEDIAFQAADENDFIPMEALVKSVPDGEAIWSHLTSD